MRQSRVTLGSSAGGSLDGGSIGLQLTGHIATRGDAAVGLVLQSVGAGGGTATVLGASALDVTVGGSAGASGAGGDIAFTHRGDVSTTGARSHGLLLQSIGGGGGAVFSDVGTSHVTTATDNSGNGGTIDYTQVGDIVTTGAGSHGLVVQSLGGGGGFVDGGYAASAGGRGAGGYVTLALDGSIVTTGAGSIALFVQSAGGSGAGDIRADLASGHSIVGGTGGAAVVFDGGARNVFGNLGSVMNAEGLSGMAFRGGSGGDMIDNRGVVLGNVDLGGGLNGFANRAGASLYTGRAFNLGAPGNLLVQDGYLSPGGRGLVLTTDLSGSLRQGRSATADYDLDLATDQVDALVATGTAELAGTLYVSLMNIPKVRPGHHAPVVYSGAAGLVDDGLVLRAPASVVISYDILADATTASLGYDVDFSPTGVEGNRVAIGDYFNRVQLAGSSAAFADTIITLVGQSQLDAYSDLLTQLGAEFYAEQLAYTLGSAQQFASTLQDCGSSSLQRSLGSKPGCFWARVDVDASTRELDLGFPAAAQTTRRYSQGVQYARDGGWSYGIGLGLEHADSRGFARAWLGEATTVQLGVLARRTSGPTSAGAVLALGTSDQDVHRRLSVTRDLVGYGRRSIGFASAVFDVAQQLEVGRLTLTPALNVGFSALRGSSVTEAGAAEASVLLERGSQNHAWIEPTVGLAFEHALANRKLLSVYARLGALRYLSGTATEVRAGLAGAPPGVEPMRLTSDLDRTHLTLEGGLQLIALDRFMLAAAYQWQVSAIRDGRMGSLRIAIPLR